MPLIDCEEQSREYSVTISVSGLKAEGGNSDAQFEIGSGGVAAALGPNLITVGLTQLVPTAAPFVFGIMVIWPDMSFDYVERLGSEMPSGITIHASVPARLLCDYTKVSREDWGPMGLETIDLQQYRNAVYNWWTWPGDDAEVTITFASGGYDPINLTHTLTASNMLSADSGGGINGLNLQRNASVAVSCSLNGTNPGVPAVDETYYFNDVEDPNNQAVRFAGSGNTITVTCPTNLWGEGAKVSFGGIPRQTISISPKAFDFRGRQLAMGYPSIGVTPGPDNVDHVVNTHYPIGSEIQLYQGETWTRSGVRSGVEVEAYGQIGGDVIDTRGSDPAFGFTYNGMESGGRSPEAFRLPLDLPYISEWDALKFTFLSSVPLEDTGGWTAGANTTVSFDDGTTEIHGTAPLTAEREYIYQDGINTARYMRYRMRGVNGATTVTLSTSDGRQWQKQITGSFEDYDFDLCAPDNLSGIAYHESLWQSGAGDWAWGLKAPVVVTWTCSDDIEIQQSGCVLFSPTTRGHVECAESIHMDDVYHIGDDLYVRRGILASLAGKAAIDQYIGIVEKVITGDTIASLLTIENVFDECEDQGANFGLVTIQNLKTGTASPFTLVTVDGNVDCYKASEYFNNKLPAYLLRETHKHADDGTVTIKARGFADRIQLGVGVDATLLSTRWFGGGLHGIVCDSDANSLSGARVDVVRYPDEFSPGSIVDQDTTDAQAVYNMPKSFPGMGIDAFPQAAFAYYAESEFGPGSLLDVPHLIGRRISFSGQLDTETADGGDLLYDQVSGEGYFASVIDDKLKVSRTLTGGVTWEPPQAVDGIEDVWSPALFRPPDHLGSLGIAWVDSSGIHFTTSTDGFVTRGPVVDITNGGDHVRIISNPATGVTLAAWYDDGSLMTAVSYDGGETFETAVEATDDAADAPFGLHMVPDHLGSWQIRYRDTGGNPVTTNSTDDGQVWATPA